MNLEQNVSQDPLPSERVLVIDADGEHTQLVVRVLSEAGYEVHVATGADDALDLLTTQTFQLVILDVVVAGLELCRRIKADPKTSMVPVIMLSSETNVDDVVWGLGAGAENFLSKPLDASSLRAHVKALLRFANAVRTASANQGDIATLFRSRIGEVAKKASLTPREREILDLLILGRSIADIAGVLGIASRTVKFHQAKMLEKIGADSRFDLFRILL